MDSIADYHRANKGFTVNGIPFVRLLGTNGGVKTSTIVYVNQAIFPALIERLDNGRDPAVPLVPAKLEAYRALACSGSTPVSAPRGVLVVEDCGVVVADRGRRIKQHRKQILLHVADFGGIVQIGRASCRERV